MIALALIIAMAGCRSFNTDYIAIFGQFLDYSLGVWECKETDSRYIDGIIDKRSWRAEFYDKDGVKQIFEFDNASYREGDSVHFGKAVYEKALEMASSKLLNMAAPDDNKVAFNAILLSSRILSQPQAQEMASIGLGPKLSDLDEASIIRDPSNYALVSYFHYSREAYESALGGSGAIYEKLCGIAGGDINMIIEFSLLSMPLSESGGNPGDALESSEVAWIKGSALKREEGQPSFKDSFPILLKGAGE